jgi:C1A family cysteine protease
MQTINKRIGGWRPDVPDHNDILYALPVQQKLPASVDLRPNMPPVRDQGQVGACTAFGVTAMLEYDRIINQMSPFAYSELYLYYQTRRKEGTENSDAGATIRDTIKIALKLGVCAEDLWPYVESNVTVAPPQSCDESALAHQAREYQRVLQDIIHMKSVLAAGKTFTSGISVYKSFMSDAVAKTGKIPMPKRGEKLLGGHACAYCGYEGDTFIGQNSWSEEWGDHGYFYIPADYLINAKLSGDSWTIQSVE